MNPLLQSALTSALRWALAILAGYLVKHGIFSDSAAEGYVEAAVPALIALGWSWWEKSNVQKKILTALMMPAGSTENDLKAHLDSGAVTPTIFTPPSTAPGVPLPVQNPTKPVPTYPVTSK